MKRTMGGAVLLTAVMAVMPGRGDAQQGARGQRAMRGPAARPGVEQIMRLRDRLELTDGQIDQLDRIRGEVVRHRSARGAEMAEMRSRLLAGQVERDDMREQMQAGREEARAYAEQVRERVESVLTDDQKHELTDLAGRARAFQRGRASAGRGGGRGAVRGRRGGGQGPGWARGAGGPRSQRPMQRSRRGGADGMRGPGGAESDSPPFPFDEFGPGPEPDEAILGFDDFGPGGDLESEFWWFELEPVTPPPPPGG